MKRTERHHLKDNELANTLVAAAAYADANRPRLFAAGSALIALVLIGGGVYLWMSRTDSRGQELLADALTTLNAGVVPAAPTSEAPGELPAAATMGAIGTFPTQEAKLDAALPKLKAAADAYPDSPAGITARYHYAGALAALGRHEEAITAFGEVIERAGDGIYGRMAALGQADTQAKAGQLDAAIASWKALVDRGDNTVPEDALLMELARAYQANGSLNEARETYTRVVEQHPTSPYAAEARVELDAIKL